jgi:hypothetical protein
VFSPQTPVERTCRFTFASTSGSSGSADSSGLPAGMRSAGSSGSLAADKVSLTVTHNVSFGPTEHPPIHTKAA